MGNARKVQNGKGIDLLPCSEKKSGSSYHKKTRGNPKIYILHNDLYTTDQYSLTIEDDCGIYIWEGSIIDVLVLHNINIDSSKKN